MLHIHKHPQMNLARLRTHNQTLSGVRRPSASELGKAVLLFALNINLLKKIFHGERKKELAVNKINCTLITEEAITSNNEVERSVHIFDYQCNEVKRPAYLMWEYAVKGIFDRSVALLLLVLLLPLFVVICTIILCDSPGGVFFRQKRHGLRGKVFEIIKFRTMHTMFCDDGVSTSIQQATRNDPRVTRIGRVLRRTSLDELPQLINVLQGEMSFVGPRPHAVAHDRAYEKLIPNYAHRFQVKPGITGLAQIEGLRGPTPTLESMAHRVTRDLDYIASWSLWLDLQILSRTLLAGFCHERAF